MFGIKKDNIFGVYDIVEFKVIKETEKQYILQNIEREQYLYNKITVNKSKMRNSDYYLFVHTLEEAKAIRQLLIKDKIERNIKSIENFKKQNERLMAKLKEME